MVKSKVSTNSYVRESYKILKSKEDSIESLLNILNIVGEVTRFKIIFLLREKKKLYIKELSEILDISHSAVSHQAKILQRAGLIKKKKEGQKVSCSLVPSNLISDLFKNLLAIEKLSKQVK